MASPAIRMVSNGRTAAPKKGNDRSHRTPLRFVDTKVRPVVTFSEFLHFAYTIAGRDGRSRLALQIVRRGKQICMRMRIEKELLLI